MSALDFLGIGPALAGQAGETLRYFVRSAADGRELERGPDPGSLAAGLGAAYCNLHRADLHAALGVDVVALGEHHRPEYSISTPETVLVGIATRTSRIRLASGVTVLSSDDPVRLFQRFATVDALLQARAEVILGRGSFTESFPLFGYDLKDYDKLFEEKLELFAKLLDEKPVTWQGTTRTALDHADVFPKTESARLRTWVGAGGSPQSVVRIARYSLPLMLAIIGGPARRFRPYIELYQRVAEQLGTTAHPVGMHTPGSSPTPTRKPRRCSGRATG